MKSRGFICIDSFLELKLLQIVFEFYSLNINC